MLQVTVVVDSSLPCPFRCDYVRLEFVCVPPSFRLDGYRSRTQSDDRGFDRKPAVTSAPGPLPPGASSTATATTDSGSGNDTTDGTAQLEPCRLCGNGLTWLRASESTTTAPAPSGQHASSHGGGARGNSGSSSSGGGNNDSGESSPCLQGWFCDSAFDSLGGEPSDRAARALKQAWPVLLTAAGYGSDGTGNVKDGGQVGDINLTPLDVNAPALGTTLVMDVPCAPSALQPGANVMRFQHPAVEAGLYHLESVNVLVGSLRLVDPYPDVTFPDLPPPSTTPSVAAATATTSFSGASSAALKSARVASGVDVSQRTLRVFPRAVAWNLWIRMPRSVFMGCVYKGGGVGGVHCSALSPSPAWVAVCFSCKRSGC